MPDADILTEQRVAEILRLLPHGALISECQEIARSHERLRGRLAEAEQERVEEREEFKREHDSLADEWLDYRRRIADAQAALEQFGNYNEGEWCFCPDDWWGVEHELVDGEHSPACNAARAALASSGADSGKEEA